MRQMSLKFTQCLVIFLYATTILASPTLQTIESDKERRIDVMCNTGMACREDDYTFELCEEYCNDGKGPDGWHAVCQDGMCCCKAHD
ncbi:hypothetical protein Hanom_Chr15g01402491 [Helianthus anomalus]